MLSTGETVVEVQQRKADGIQSAQGWSMSFQSAIWLCLPMGFPSGCGAAKSALIKRVRKFKSPLPSFSSCAVNPLSGSGDRMTSAHGFAAYIPTHRICKHRDTNTSFCYSYKVVPEGYVKNAHCLADSRTGIYYPRHCTYTSRWAEVFINGQLIEVWPGFWTTEPKML